MRSAPTGTATPGFLVYAITPIEKAFKKFHTDNPHVYKALEHLAMEAWKAGVKKLGIAALAETLRYNAALQTQGDAYKINNSYRALYARLLRTRHPELRDLLETRVRRTSAPSAYTDD